MTLRLIIADDSALMREGISYVLQDNGIDVVAAVGDVAALLCAVGELRPDLAVVDIRMPAAHTPDGLDPDDDEHQTAGIAAAISIRRTHPATGVLLLSQYEETDAAMTLLEEQAAGIGYLLKDRVTQTEQFISAVHRVASGGTAIDSELVRRIVRRPHRTDPLRALTDRERSVLSLMAEGKSNQAIGDELFLSLRTVEKHIAAIFSKLGLRDEPNEHRRVRAVLAYLKATSA